MNEYISPILQEIDRSSRLSAFMLPCCKTLPPPNNQLETANHHCFLSLTPFKTSLDPFRYLMLLRVPPPANTGHFSSLLPPVMVGGNTVRCPRRLTGLQCWHLFLHQTHHAWASELHGDAATSSHFALTDGLTAMGGAVKLKKRYFRKGISFQLLLPLMAEILLAHLIGVYIVYPLYIYIFYTSQVVGYPDF